MDKQEKPYKTHHIHIGNLDWGDKVRLVSEEYFVLCEYTTVSDKDGKLLELSCSWPWKIEVS